MNWLQKTFEISHATHNAILSMEGIRGFAVFLVFLVHYVSLIKPWLDESSITFHVSEYIHSIGSIGVDLFFVLSGYLIYGMLIKKHRAFKGYMIRRIQRIYPTFTVVFIIYLTLSVLFPFESKIPIEWKDALIFIIQNYLLMPGLFDVTAIVTVAWSLSYEFFYYLAIPLLIASLSMRSWKMKYRIIFFILITLCCFYYFSENSGPIRLVMFISGILLYETIENEIIKNMPPVGLLALVLAIVSVIVLVALGYNDWWRYLFLYVLFYIFCLECFLLSGFTTQLFLTDPLRWLGNMSYSYYLLHGLTLKFIFMMLEIIHPSQGNEVLILWMLLPPFFLLTLIPSAVLFIYIEKPYSLVGK